MEGCTLGEHKGSDLCPGLPGKAPLEGLGFPRGVPPEAKRRGKGIGGKGNRVSRAQVDKSMAVWACGRQ